MIIDQFIMLVFRTGQFLKAFLRGWSCDMSRCFSTLISCYNIRVWIESTWGSFCIA